MYINAWECTHTHTSDVLILEALCIIFCCTHNVLSGPQTTHYKKDYDNFPKSGERWSVDERLCTMVTAGSVTVCKKRLC